MTKLLIIGHQTIDEAVAIIKDHLIESLDEINEAYDKFEKKLIIPYKLRFTEPKTGGGVRVRASTTFATQKVKVSADVVVNEHQNKLPLKE